MILPESCCPTTLQLAHSLEQSIAQLPWTSSFSSAQINDEVKTTVLACCLRSMAQIAIAARTLGRCAAGTFILPEML